MVKMTAEQEAQYALNFGVARSDLPEDAQLAYDRLAEQRARAPTPAAVSGADAEDRRVIMPKWVAALGTALFIPLDGLGLVLLPWLLTQYQPGAHPYPLAVRALGVALIAAGGIVVLVACVRFVTEGIGIPWPFTVTSGKLIVGGVYGSVRNPIYLAAAVAIVGQALLLSRPVLLVYTAGFLAFSVVWVRLFEETLLAERFGADYDAYRKQVPGWWPRLRRRTLSSHASSNADTRSQP
jgi:protein-S-isoprenylcysteine O-methyltransferase Ste14